MAVFLYGFAKSERDNVDDGELATARDIARGWLGAESSGIARAVAEQLLHEVKYDGQAEEG
jgi:hypothetical protein